MLLLVTRLIKHVFYKWRHRKEFTLALPTILLLAATWAWGEFTGYFTGRSETTLAPKTCNTTDAT